MKNEMKRNAFYLRKLFIALKEYSIFYWFSTLDENCYTFVEFRQIFEDKRHFSIYIFANPLLFISLIPSLFAIQYFRNSNTRDNNSCNEAKIYWAKFCFI